MYIAEEIQGSPMSSLPRPSTKNTAGDYSQSSLSTIPNAFTNLPHENQIGLRTDPKTNESPSLNLNQLSQFITDDDVEAIKRLKMPIEDLSKIKFGKNMNILNIAIDKEAQKTV
jgi:hypothetical protein